MARFAQTARTVPARFQSIGTVIDGTVLSITDEPVPEFVNGRVVGPRRTVGGEIMTQADVVLDVAGVNTLVHTRGGIEYAIATELHKIGADDLHPGDYLSLTWAGEEDMGADLDPAKVFSAKIVPGGKRGK